VDLGVASFLPPLFQQYTSQSVLLMIGAGIGIFVCMVLHLIFIGIAAKRLGRSPLLWVILTLCTLPLGSIIGLICSSGSPKSKNRPPLKSCQT
jgi:hypothetical protein